MIMKKAYVVIKTLHNKNEIIFVTSKKSKAIRYVVKFNSILEKWKNHYRQYEVKGMGIWLANKETEKYRRRHYCLNDIYWCYWEEVEVR